MKRSDSKNGLITNPQTMDDYRSLADYYRKEAEKHQHSTLLFKKNFLKTGVFMIAVFVVFIIATSAWFVINRKVTGNGGSISARPGALLELATLKDGAHQGVYDDNSDAATSKLVAALKINSTKGYTSFLGLPSFLATGSEYEYDNKKYIIGDGDSVSMMVSETSNLNNNQINKQIGPGSRGQFTFYIIPRANDLGEVTATITLEGYTIEGDTTVGQVLKLKESTQISDEAKTNIWNCICGHILLFENKDADGNYTNRVFPAISADNKIVFTLSPRSGFTMDVPYPITVYWIWPHHFEDMIYPGLGESVFRTACAGQVQMLNWLNDDNNKKLIFSQTDDLDDINLVTITNTQLMAWSTAYNKGDQLIGNHVLFFNWMIEASNQ